MKRENGEGSIINLGKRRRRPWAARVTVGWDENGKQIKKYIGYAETKKGAKQLLDAYNLHPTSRDTCTLKEIYEDWKKLYFERDISEQTKHGYEYGFSLWKPLHNKKIRDIKTATMQKMFNSVKLSKSSKQKMKIVINLIFKYAMENDIVNKNYAEFLHVNAPAQKKKEPFSHDEIKTLFANDTFPFVDAILILFFTGFRISEFLNIKKENIDLENMIIVGGGKTKAGTDRIVPIIPLIEDYVRKRYDASRVYLIEENGKQITDDHWRKAIYYKPLEALGIERKTPHQARHTCGTIMAESGVSPVAIKSILGHTNYAFTANVYTHVDIEFLKDEMKKISTVDYKQSTDEKTTVPATLQEPYT